MAGEDTRLAYQEIQKLVTYTNGQRPVEAEDVDQLASAEGKLENFALPNALREMDGRKALNVLHRMLEDEDPIMLLGSVTKQVRILLLAREVLDQGGGVNEVVSELTSHPSLKITAYPARLAAGQAQRISMADLEAIYRRLLEIDEAIKTSQMDGDVALDLFVTNFTAR
jgi:DNA polymerase-3 subunit delta